MSYRIPVITEQGIKMVDMDEKERFSKGNMLGEHIKGYQKHSKMSDKHLNTMMESGGDNKNIASHSGAAAYHAVQIFKHHPNEKVGKQYLKRAFQHHQRIGASAESGEHLVNIK